MIDYIAYLEAQKKMRQQFEFRANAITSDPATAEMDRHRAGTPLRHGLAAALRAAATRLDPVAA
jgi:hypothetical protein